MFRATLYVFIFGAGVHGCGGLPEGPPQAPIAATGLPSWDSVKESTHTRATRPPEPVLVVDREQSKCFKAYTIFPQEYRLPNGQAYGIRECNSNCGTEIKCPDWAQDVYADWTKRNQNL